MDIGKAVPSNVGLEDGTQPALRLERVNFGASNRRAHREVAFIRSDVDEEVIRSQELGNRRSEEGLINPLTSQGHPHHRDRIDEEKSAATQWCFHALDTKDMFHRIAELRRSHAH